MIKDGEITELNTLVAGPVPDAELVPGAVADEYGYLYWDDINGTWLDTAEVKKARGTELSWVHERKVYDIVPRSEATSRNMKPKFLKWIDND